MITAVLFTLAAAFPVTIRVDAGQPLGELPPSGASSAATSRTTPP